MKKLFAILYNVSSVHKVVEFVKTVYVYNNAIPVIVKPVGAAAQIGVPEAHKISYKLNKPLIILPELSDIINVLGVKKNYIVTVRGVEVSVAEVVKGEEDIAITLNGSDAEFTKQELEYGEPVMFKDIPANLPSTALLAVILNEIKRLQV